MTLYYSNIQEFHHLPGAHLLHPQRQAQLASLRQPADQQRCLVAGLLCRWGLGEDYGQILLGLQGKPQLPGGRGPYFNLSHGGDWVVFVRSGHLVGVDVQPIAPYSAKIPQKYFTQEEQDWLATQEGNQPFFQLWTGKESLMKADGRGFSLSPASFSLLPVQDGPHQEGERSWHLYWRTLEESQICLCSACPQDSLDFRRLGPEDLCEKCEI